MIGYMASCQAYVNGEEYPRHIEINGDTASEAVSLLNRWVAAFLTPIEVNPIEGPHEWEPPCGLPEQHRNGCCECFGY